MMGGGPSSGFPHQKRHVRPLHPGSPKYAGVAGTAAPPFPAASPSPSTKTLSVVTSTGDGLRCTSTSASSANFSLLSGGGHAASAGFGSRFSVTMGPSHSNGALDCSVAMDATADMALRHKLALWGTCGSSRPSFVPTSPEKSSSFGQTTQRNFGSTPERKPVVSTSASSDSFAHVGANFPLSHAVPLKRSCDSNSATEPGGEKRRKLTGVPNEQKPSRSKIKNGFDTLERLVTNGSQIQSTGAGFVKLSKAGLLQKAADRMKHLEQETQRSQREVEKLKAQIDALSKDITSCQKQLPDTGAPIVPLKTTRVMELFEDVVKQKTLEDWKFWVFSLIANPMAATFSEAVSTTSMDAMCQSTMAWTEQHCSLANLRPSVLNSLRYLSTNTSILSNPEKLPEEALKAVARSDRSSTSNPNDSRRLFSVVSSRLSASPSSSTS